MHRHRTARSPASLTTSLAIAVALLAAIAALAGLLWEGGNGPYTVTTYRGQVEEIYGTGVYRDSSTFTGAGARGSDFVTLLAAIPLLATGLALHRRGAARGTLLLAGALAWFVYLHGSLSLGAVAYNDLFLLYIATFAASLWALVLLLAGFGPTTLAASLTPGVPRRALGVFLIIAGTVTMAIWLMEPIAGLVTGDLPASLGVSSTLLTTALDIAVIAPATWIAGALVLRGQAVGYLAAVPLLVLAAMLAPMITAQTIFQLGAGVELTTAEMVGPIGGFIVIAAIAIWLIVRVTRHIEEKGERPRPLALDQPRRRLPSISEPLRPAAGERPQLRQVHRPAVNPNPVDPSQHRPDRLPSAVRLDPDRLQRRCVDPDLDPAATREQRVQPHQQAGVALDQPPQQAPVWEVDRDHVRTWEHAQRPAERVGGHKPKVAGPALRRAAQMVEVGIEPDHRRLGAAPGEVERVPPVAGAEVDVHPLESRRPPA